MQRRQGRCHCRFARSGIQRLIAPIRPEIVVRLTYTSTCTAMVTYGVLLTRGGIPCPEGWATHQR